MWFIDVETAPRMDLPALMPAFSAPANYKDAAKIAAAVEEKRSKWLDSATVNVNFARIAVLGVLKEDGTVYAPVCRTEEDERHALATFWRDWIGAGRPTLCGFFNSQFDLPLMVRRSQILGVELPSPGIELGRYRHPEIVDLAQTLTFDWMLDAEKLSAYLKVFGIPHDDAISGKDVPALIAAGDYETPRQHCLMDLEGTRALAARLGVR